MISHARGGVLCHFSGIQRRRRAIQGLQTVIQELSRMIQRRRGVFPRRLCIVGAF
jgi:hypothetical protein